MTRLVSEWIMEMEESAADWNDVLKAHISMDFIDLAAKVSGRSRLELEQSSGREKVAVVPITSGLGTIGSFAQSVAAIVRAMGFQSFVTEKTDVDGLYEAYVKDAGFVFMADDDRYIALNRKKGVIGDNNIATASGYSEALLALAGFPDGARGKRIAVLGYGIIGRLMAAYLAGKGAVIYVYDKDLRVKTDAEDAGYRWIDDAEDLRNFKFIADATSEGDWLGVELLHEEAVIAAPGIPLSLTEEAQTKYAGRYIHDLLEIGTAGMLGLAL